MTEKEKAVNLVLAMLERFKEKYFFEPEPFIHDLVNHFGKESSANEQVAFNYAVMLEVQYRIKDKKK